MHISYTICIYQGVVYMYHISHIRGLQQGHSHTTSIYCAHIVYLWMGLQYTQTKRSLKDRPKQLICLQQQQVMMFSFQFFMGLGVGGEKEVTAHLYIFNFVFHIFTFLYLLISALLDFSGYIPLSNSSSMRDLEYLPPPRWVTRHQCLWSRALDFQWKIPLFYIKQGFVSSRFLFLKQCCFFLFSDVNAGRILEPTVLTFGQV